MAIGQMQWGFSGKYNSDWDGVGPWHKYHGRSVVNITVIMMVWGHRP